MATRAKSKKSKKPNKLDAKAADRRIAAYEKQFIMLEGKLYKLEAENANLRARIHVLEEANPSAAIQTMTDAELNANIDQYIKKMGYVKKSSGKS